MLSEPPFQGTCITSSKPCSESHVVHDRSKLTCESYAVQYLHAIICLLCKGHIFLDKLYLKHTSSAMYRAQSNLSYQKVSTRMVLQGAAQSLREQMCIGDFLHGAELSQDTSPCKLDSEAWIPKLPLQNCSCWPIERYMYPLPLPEAHRPVLQIFRLHLCHCCTAHCHPT